MSDLIRDLNVDELREHLNQWWVDRKKQSMAGNLNDHQYLFGVVRDMVQDTGELFNITLGILDRLSEQSTPTTNPITKEKP